MKFKLFILGLLLGSACLVSAQTATINWTNVHQVIDGFGASDAQSGLGTPTPLTTAQQNFFFGTGSAQLGLSILRTGVTDGSSDPGSCVSIGSSCAGNYVSDMEAVIANGGRVYATSWTPPAAYKSNSNASCQAGAGNGTLSNQSAYATWLVNFIDSLAAQSPTIPLYAISPQNEPDQCTSYDSSITTDSQQDTFIKTYLGPALASTGASTLVMMPENSGYGAITGSNGGTTCMEDSSCYAYVGGVTFHDYDSTYSSPDTVNADPYPSGWATGKKYWETEAGCLSGQSPVYPTWCPSGVNNNITDALSWAAIIDQRIVNDGVNAWLYWWLISNENTDDQGLLQLNGTIAPRAYMLGQYSKFVRPGYYRIDATHQPASGVTVSAYQNTPNNTLVIIATNYTGSSSTVTFDVTNAPSFTSLTPTITSSTQNLATLSPVSLSGDSFIYTLPPQSIITFSGTSSSNCPSGVPSGVTSCSYIAASGNDSNDGLSEANGHPWLHAPGMPNCSSNCAANSPAAGDGYIFEGGGTWHFGNSGASPYTGGLWTIAYTGTSSNPIYFGVDQTWFSGASWTRPILTGDNPLTTHPGVYGDSVSSCPYQIGSSATNNMVSLPSTYVVFDNFEETGLCEPANQTGSIIDIYNIGSGASNVTDSNIYVHGWTHTTFSCTPGSPPTGTCNDINAFYGGASGVTLNGVVVDGSDSDPGGAFAAFIAANTVVNTVFRYVSQYVSNDCHILANTWFDHIVDPADGEAHGNVYECVGEQSGLNAYYNNVVSNAYYTGTPAVNFWIGPSPGTTDYFFNNVFYNIGTVGNYLNINSGSNPQGATYAFNNTLQSSIGDPLMSCGPTGVTNVFSQNNHFINLDGSSPYYDPGTCQTATNLVQTNSTANSQGYTGSSTYAYQTTSPTGGTVGTGTDKNTANCSPLLASSDPSIQAAGTACQKGTGYAVSYNQTNHSVSFPALSETARPSSWDVGAYQYSGGSGSPIAVVSPSSLAFGSQTDGTTSSPQIVTITNTGTASLVFSGSMYALTTGTQFAIGPNTCLSVYANSLPASSSCTISITFSPTSSGAKSDTLTLTNNSGGTPGSQQTVGLSGTGISGPTWTLNQHITNYTCTGTTPSTIQSCSVTASVPAGHTLILASAIWSNSGTPTFNSASGDTFIHCGSCYAAGTHSPKAFASDAVYILKATASSSQTYTVTWNTVASIWSIDVDLIDVTVSSGTVALDGDNSLGYTYPSCSTACTSPSLSLSGTSDYVLQWGGLGYGPATAPGNPYTSPSDIDSSNVWGAFFGAVNQSSVSTVTWSSTPNNYPATSVIAFKSTSSTGLAAPAIVLSSSN